MKNKKNTLKFLLGQETGYKVEAVAVAQEMRYARDGGGNRGFTIDEFLVPQRVTSFFSRMASKLKDKTKRSSKNIRLPLRFKLPSSTRTNILENCQLIHPIAKRASDVMTQTKLRQTNRNGGRFS